MGSNELVTRRKAQMTTIENPNTMFKEVPIIKYSLADSSRYSFEYKVDDDIDVNMFESDRSFENNEFIDGEFEEGVGEKDHSYYLVAAASGVLTGTLACINLSDETLYKINEWKNKDWDKYISIVANLAGYTAKDIKGAKTFLKERFVPFVDAELQSEVQEGLDTWLNYLSNHPSLAGLVFSIFTQFSEERYCFKDKDIEKEAVPEYYAIGRDTVERLAYGVLYWVFNLSIDVAISKIAVLEESNIPQAIVKILKELYRLPIFAEIPKNYRDAEQMYSELIKKIFVDHNILNKDDSEKNDLYGLFQSLSGKIFLECFPVVLNECIVRSFYAVKKLIEEIKDKDIREFEDINKVDLNAIKPFNNRLISKMILVSSGNFVAVNVAGAALKAVINHDKQNGKFKETMLSEIKIAGVGRFFVACIADSKYWSDDIKVFFQRKNKRKVDESVEEEKIVNDMFSNDSLQALSLSPELARVLYSLEAIAVAKDIEHTSKADEKAVKQLWLDTWKNAIISGLGVDSMDYFVADEDLIYKVFNSIDQTEENLRCFYLLAMELVVFRPYYPLGVSNDTKFKKINMEKYNYIDDQFARRQIIINQKEIDSLREYYKKYKGIISGSTQNTIIAAGVAAVAAFATGGVAFAFAPGIATLIAGEAVVGLHGAALTSASLAFVGGGSLAAGGLGMAGGTAIITGGGALLGIAGSGSTSMAVILSQTGHEYWIRQASKMLTFSKCVLKERLNDGKLLNSLKEEVDDTIRKVELNIRELEAEKCSLDKTVIQNSKECLKYLKKCKAELEKIL